MPTYDFECRACGKVFEAICKFEESKTLKCQCGGDTIRQMSAPGFEKEQKEFFSHALGYKVPGVRGWKKEMKRKGFNHELNPY